jgi:hypothetical protein
MPVALISEFFTFELEGTMVFADVLGDPRWFDAMTQQAVPAPWTTVRHPSEAWYPRSAFVSRVVSSPPEASAFEQYFDSNPVLYHVIVMPPVPTP